jgi:hypothetical protein
MRSRLSIKDAELSSKVVKVICMVLYLLAGFVQFLEGSAICVTEMFRIKKTVSKNLDRITGRPGLILTIVFHKQILKNHLFVTS